VIGDLPPAIGLLARDVALEFVAVPSDRVLGGSPAIGHAVLGTIGGVEFGVWEHTAGISTDVEIDEVFIVLAGMGTVEFDDGHPPLQLGPGTIARLQSGMRTVWTVTETLRKVYWSPSPPVP
jgi:uncharacterized cupin superfamily protein